MNIGNIGLNFTSGNPYGSMVASADFSTYPNQIPISQGGIWGATVTGVVIVGLLKIVGGICIPTSQGADHAAIYLGASWPSDQISAAKGYCLGSTGGSAGPGVCVRSTTSGSSATQYVFTVDQSNTGEIFWNANDTYGTVVSFNNIQFVQGAWLYLAIVGNKLYPRYNGVSLGVYTDNKILSGGYPGIYYSSNETSASWTNWVGGIP